MISEYTDDEENSKLYFDKYQSKDKVEFLHRILDLLLSKSLPDIERRKLQVGRVYLAYHPLVPEEGFIMAISFKSDDLFYELTYSHEMIAFSQFYTDEGSVYYNYKYSLYQNGRKDEEGDFYSSSTDFEFKLKGLPADEISISNDYV